MWYVCHECLEAYLGYDVIRYHTNEYYCQECWKKVKEKKKEELERVGKA